MGYRLWVSRASVGVCLTLYNILLNTIQDDSSTKTNAWRQFRKWAWKGVRGRILLEHLKWFEGSSVHLNPQECVNEVLGTDKMNKIYCWYPFIYLLNWGMWIIPKILMLCFTNSHATVCRYTKMHGCIKNGVSVIPGCVRWGLHGAGQFARRGPIHLHCSTVGLRAQHNAEPYWRLPREAASASSCHVRSRRPSDGSAHALPPKHKGSAYEEGS